MKSVKGTEHSVKCKRSAPCKPYEVSTSCRRDRCFAANILDTADQYLQSVRDKFDTWPLGKTNQVLSHDRKRNAIFGKK